MNDREQERDLSTADLASRHHERRDKRGEPREDERHGPGQPRSGREDLREMDEPANVAEEREQNEARREEETGVPLFSGDDERDLRRRWDAIQTGFVDDPRRTVEDADHLVAETIQKLADSFARSRGALEGQWSRGRDVSTEDLRQLLQRYRSFFQRLLKV